MLSEAHITTSPEQLDDIVLRIKEISGKGRKVTENDLYEIAETVIGQSFIEKNIILDDIAILTGNHVLATATVKATVDGSERICCRTGNGPVDAAMNALLGIVPSGMQLKEYSVSAISGGSDAIGHVTIAVEDEKGRIYDASASSDNIVLASVDAMINALNLVSRTR